MLVKDVVIDTERAQTHIQPVIQLNVIRQRACKGGESIQPEDTTPH